MSGARAERRLARKRLEAALPRARGLAAEYDAEPLRQSAVAKAQVPHWREDNLDRLEIKRGEYGGWIADVVFKRVPMGVADTIGTPVQRPWPTREEAEESGVRLVAAVLAAEKRMRESPPAAAAPRVFQYFDITLTPPEEFLRLVELAKTATPELLYGSVERALQRLDEETERLFPEGEPTLERFKALDDDDRAWVFTVCSLALAEGVFRYPPWVAEPVGRYPAAVGPDDLGPEP